ncbi:MAG: polysaccharide biosynthesis/export family protein [Marinirhabdus sp.]|nr:polysaccharide biosynthesis/export family protein [Marinirhabdus sp.]
MKNLFCLLIIVLGLTSCATKKEIIYFQNAEELNQKEAAQYFEPQIIANDILYISVSALSEEVLQPYKRNLGERSTNVDEQLRGYLVATDGTIQYPGLGKVMVAGKTRKEAIEILTEKLSAYVKDIVVDVRIINFKITVLGEVSRPGVYTIKDERVTLPQAIGLAGDFTLDGNREQVVIIRQVEGAQQVARIDFTQTDLFSSPYYFLKQNDVVYVEPSLKGVKKSGFIPDVPALLSLVTIVLSAVIIISR